jgi:Uma2 family endonuclease
MTATATSPRIAAPAKYQNAEQWLRALGEVPLSRVVMDPWPGTATEEDLLRFVEVDDRLVELVNGTLVEKPVGLQEALIASYLITVLNNFVIPRKLGYVAGADGTLRMALGNIRLPDVCFISVEDCPAAISSIPNVPMLPPTLAIEVISESNTKAEMKQKLKEYFESRSRLVWFVYPKTRTVAVYVEPSDEPARVLGDTEVLDGGSVLPGFALPVTDIFDRKL